MKKILVLSFMLLSAIGFGQLSTVPMGVGTKLNVAFPIINTAIDQINVNTAAIAGFTGTGLGFENVQDYGATGNGVTDDATDIQSALTAGIGGVVFLPAGTYLIKSRLVVGSNTVVMGEGYESTIIKCDPAFTDKDAIFEFLANAKNIRVKGLHLDGNANNFTPKKGEHMAFYATNIDDVTVERVKMRNFSQFVCEIETGCNNWNFENCYFTYSGDTLNAGGIYSKELIGLRVNNCVFDSLYQHGIYFDDGAEVNISNS